MKAATTSLRAFGIYMIVVPGLGFMILPEFSLDLLGLRHGGYFWMARSIGLLAFVIGVYDLFFAKYELVQFYKLSVLLRYFGALILTGLWMIGEVEVWITLFAAIDLASATWTLMAVKKSTVKNEW